MMSNVDGGGARRYYWGVRFGRKFEGFWPLLS